VKKMLLLLAITLSAVLAALTLTAVPAANAAPGLRLSLASLSVDELRVRAVCPVDPPQTLFLSSDQGLIASGPVTCTRRNQVLTAPTLVTLTPGQVLTNVTITISGDSGEINAFYDQVVVRR